MPWGHREKQNSASRWLHIWQDEYLIRDCSECLNDIIFSLLFLLKQNVCTVLGNGEWWWLQRGIRPWDTLKWVRQYLFCMFHHSLTQWKKLDYLPPKVYPVWNVQILNVVFDQFWYTTRSTYLQSKPRYRAFLPPQMAPCCPALWSLLVELDTNEVIQYGFSSAPVYLLPNF